MRTLKILITVSSVYWLCISVAFAADQIPSKKQVYLASGETLIQIIANRADTRSLSADVDLPEVVNYSFSTGVSKEKGSFKLGLLYAGLEASVRSGDRGKSIRAIKAISEKLIELGAPDNMVDSLLNLLKGLQNKANLKEIAEVTMPVLRPFIESFVKEEGNFTCLRLGEWVESLTLAGNVTETADMPVAIRAILSMSEKFVQAFGEKEIAPGAVTSLEQLQQLGKQDRLSAVDIKKMKKEIGNLRMLFS